MFTEANFAVVDVLRAVAEEVGRPMAQVALSWVARRPGVSSVLVGVSRPECVSACNFDPLRRGTGVQF